MSCGHPERRRAWFSQLWLVLPVLVLAFPCSCLAAGDVVISASVAGLFVDEEKIVEGVVTSARREGNVVRLQLGIPPQTLTVSLVVGLLSGFPTGPENHYLGKRVRAAGTIRSFRGELEMVIRQPESIEVVGVAPRAVPAAHPQPALSAEEGSGAQRLDALSERVRRLEERVEQLERSGSRRMPASSDQGTPADAVGQ